MVGAKQLRTLGLSWFRPGPYVQGACSGAAILLRTGVPVVGRLQARWERRCGLQVPSGVIEAKANVVREGRERATNHYLLSRVWCRICPAAREITFLL
jgi:hypothetical protein